MADYRFERVDETRYGDLLYIMKASFGVGHGLEYYRHKFDTGYLGVKHLGYLAYDTNNQPAAFYGVFPYMMEYKGKNYLAAQSGDTMTHPAHGGKGLFTTLAKMTYELARKEGIQFIFGFPNENSYPGFVRKLNWTHNENMINYEAKIFTFPCAAIAKKIALLQPLHRLYTRLVFGLYKGTLKTMASSAINFEYGSVARTEQYMCYKAFNHNHIVSIAGNNAWLKVDGALLVGDINISDKNQTDKLISGLKTLAFWLGCNKIVFAVGRDTTWDILLKGKLTSTEGIYIGYLDLQSGLPLDKFKFVMADMDTF